jgi:hypothetical protein
MDGSTAMAITQEISGSIVSYIRSMRADPELYEMMASTDFADISWVPLSELERLRVVTNNIFSESFEYRNINGGLALHIEQVARNGVSSLFLFCGEKGLVGLADLNKPEENPPLSGLSISIGDIPFQLQDWEIMENQSWRLKLLFSIPPRAAMQLVKESKIGVQALQPLGTFFGFTGEPSDPKVSEMAVSCTAAFSPPPSELELYHNTDIVGGDIVSDGFKQVSLDRCGEICRSTPGCVAVSYVVDKKWCWPKQSITSSVARAGVVSAMIE